MNGLHFGAKQLSLGPPFKSGINTNQAFFFIKYPATAGYFLVNHQTRQDK
jgi:hypothetical protein